MLSVMHSETVETVSPINPEILTSAINRAIHRGVVLISEIDGKIVGSIGGADTSDWWSTEKYLKAQEQLHMVVIDALKKSAWVLIC